MHELTAGHESQLSKLYRDIAHGHGIDDIIMYDGNGSVAVPIIMAATVSVIILSAAKRTHKLKQRIIIMNIYISF